MARDEDDESRPERIKAPYRCKDRICGALDCANCFPNTYDQTSDEEAALGNATEDTEE